MSLRDFLSRKYLLLSVLPLVISVFALGGLAIFGGWELFEFLNTLAAGYMDTNKHPLLASVLEFAPSRWIIAAFFYLIGVFIVLVMSIFIALIVAGFLTPYVTKDINSKYYGIKKEGEVGFFEVIKIIILELLKFSCLLIVCLIFMVLPFINLIVINIPFFYIFYKFLLIDVASNALGAKEFRQVIKNGGKSQFVAACALFYTLSLLPLIGLFFQLFFVIFLTHILLLQEQKRIVCA